MKSTTHGDTEPLSRTRAGKSSPRLLIVVPAYNEEANLADVISDLRRHGPEWDIVVVDDGSQDNTADVAERLGVVVLRLPVNLGIGGAVQTGLIYARRGGYDGCLQVDGDGQHRGEETKSLAEALQSLEVDAVIGSRFMSGEGFQSTFLRRLGIQALRHLIRAVTGQAVTDPTSGQRAFGPRAISLLSRRYPQEYPEPEVLYILHRNGLSFREIPVAMNPRKHGISSIGLLDSLLYMVKVVLAIVVRGTSLAK